MSSQPDQSGLDFAPGFYHTQRERAGEAVPGVHIQAVKGGHLMLIYAFVEPNGVVPLHQHPHEQIGTVLEGEVEYIIAGQTRRMGKGDSYTVPSNSLHGGRGLGAGCVLVEVFTPAREDYTRFLTGEPIAANVAQPAG